MKNFSSTYHLYLCLKLIGKFQLQLQNLWLFNERSAYSRTGNINIYLPSFFFVLLTFSAAWRVLTGAFCSSGGKYWVSVVCDDPDNSTPPSEQKHRDSGVTTKTSLASVLFPSKWSIYNYLYLSKHAKKNDIKTTICFCP